MPGYATSERARGGIGQPNFLRAGRMVDDNFDDAPGWWEGHFNTTAPGRRASWAKFVQEGQQFVARRQSTARSRTTRLSNNLHPRHQSLIMLSQAWCPRWQAQDDPGSPSVRPPLDASAEPYLR